MVKKGSKITRERTFKKGAVPNQIIWNRDSFDTKQEALDTTTAVGDFVGADFDSMSLLNKELEEKEKELQNSKHYLEQVEAQHRQEIRHLRNEYEGKLKKLQRKNDYLKQPLEKEDHLNEKQDEIIYVFEQ